MKRLADEAGVAAKASWKEDKMQGDNHNGRLASAVRRIVVAATMGLAAAGCATTSTPGSDTVAYRATDIVTHAQNQVVANDNDIDAALSDIPFRKDFLRRILPLGSSLPISLNEFTAKHPSQKQIAFVTLRLIVEALEVTGYRANTLAEIAEAQIKAGFTRDARSTLVAAFNAVRRIEKLLNSYEEPDDDAGNPDGLLMEIAAIQAGAGLYVDAADTAEEIKDGGLKARVLGDIATTARAQAGRRVDTPTAANKTTEKLDTQSDTASDKDRTNTLMNTAIAQAKSGRYDEAIETVRMIRDPRDRAFAFKVIASTRGKADYPSDRAQAIASIAMAQADSGLFADAIETADMIKSELAEIPSELFTRGSALKHIANVQAKAGLYSDALRTAELIEARDRYGVLRGNTHSVVGDIYAIKSGHFLVLLTIARAQAKLGLYAEAFNTTDEIHALGLMSNDDAKPLIAIATAQAQVGHFTDALTTADRVTQDWGLRNDLLAVIAIAQAKAGFPSDALKTAGRINNKAQALQEIERIKAGHWGAR